jgi:hypothetical protein
MSSRTIRVTVRGVFDSLTPTQRADLLADAAEHDLAFAEYTTEGSLTYDIAARPFFTFRYAGTAAEEKDIPEVTAQAELAAEEYLRGRGLGFKNLTSQTVDMSQTPLGSRGRKLLEKN